MTLGELFKSSGYVVKNMPEGLSQIKIINSEGFDTKSKAFRRWLLKPSKGLANVHNLINNFEEHMYTSIRLKRYEGDFTFEFV